GVKDGGNCSGNPTIVGTAQFDPRFSGKPLVFVGTGGIIERHINDEPAEVKKADPGDYIIMVGGRVGLDGIHGATFSSEPMDEGSPATAVQIGDPITQKKMLDGIAKHAVPKGLVKIITDNGAGGLGSSVGETALFSGGAELDLDLVPTKYPGMRDDQILISESQERMTVGVEPENVDPFVELMRHHGVEATVIGQYTDSGKFVVKHKGKTVVDIDLDFLHEGNPTEKLTSTRPIEEFEMPVLPTLDDLTDTLHQMLGRLNICSKEFISRQFDHEVQDGSVIKPLQGIGEVNGDASVFRPLLHSNRGIGLSRADFFLYGDNNMYDMAVANIDAAIRQLVAVGVDPDKIHLLDNFCWCSSNEPERLGQLKRAARGCYNAATAYGTPFISGKDSMFNDFKGYDKDGRPVKISVPPTLMITGVGIVDNVEDCVTMDAKFEGDLVYVVGRTYNELGGSEYLSMQRQPNKRDVPVVNPVDNKELYKLMHEAIKQGVVASAHSVGQGGLAVALAKVAIAGRNGLDLDLEQMEERYLLTSDIMALFSESQGRFVITVAPENVERFEDAMGNFVCNKVGVVTKDKFTVKGIRGDEIISTHVGALENHYKNTLREY
ncbi:MAG: phosphoribosylformylglycinamidine synthase, partial [Nanoarchaeota archaeon]|nr:phosphoribosylformylglycinamidine synthase [Nanoarchaeota archaeon]